MRAPFADLAEKAVLVTGGNSGIGAAVARGLAETGAKVAIWGRRPDRNEEVVGEIEAAGGSAIGRVVDVAVEQQVSDGVEAAVAELGRLDAIVACAGFARRSSSILETDADDFAAVMGANLYGTYYTLREGMRHMVTRAEAGDRGGSLVGIGSLTSRTGLAGLEAYGIAKTGMVGLMRSLAVEGGAHGIRANVVCPGYIHTPPSDARATDPEFPVTRMLAEAPPGRWGRPEDLVGAIAYLVSDASAYHSGDVLTVDGALLAKTPN